jgi:hypothetical protein
MRYTFFEGSDRNRAEVSRLRQPKGTVKAEGSYAEGSGARSGGFRPYKAARARRVSRR